MLLCFNQHKSMYLQGNSRAIDARIWYLKYTHCRPLYLTTVGPFILLYMPQRRSMDINENVQRTDGQNILPLLS